MNFLKLAFAVTILVLVVGVAACGGGDTVGGASDEEVQTAESGPVEGKLTIST